MANEVVEDPKAYRWHMYWLMAFGFVFISLFVLAGVSMWAKVEQGTPMMEFVVPAIGGPLLLLFLGIHFRTFIAYHQDAKYLKRSEADYQPVWYLWVIAHWTLPHIAVPAYLFRRRRRIGNSYDGTRAGRILNKTTG